MNPCRGFPTSDIDEGARLISAYRLGQTTRGNFNERLSCGDATDTFNL